MLLGVDVGGTFTDAVLYDGERLHTAKAPSTPADQSRGVMAAIETVLSRAGATAQTVRHFAHGMTVGTNALLTESGARTVLVGTRGFTDLLDVARQNRPELYRPCRARPAPLVADGDRVEVRERSGPEGIVESLAEEEVERVVAEVRALAPESVAICLLFSFASPEHERRLADALRDAIPDTHVSASHEVLPKFREYERCSTTVIDAYLSPLLVSYLGGLVAAAEPAGLPEPAVMRSSGGVAPAREAARSGAWSVLSGPAGGAVGAALLARLSAEGDAIGFDMGGTSCDVCVVEDGAVRRTEARELGGRVVQLPMVEVHTVGAGGGSVGWRDAGGALRVGPRSAGAEPGPACYGLGGDEPTVTDANLLLGYLGPGSILAGGVELDTEAASAAVAALAAELGIDELATAEGIVRVANQEMVRALRVVTVQRGLDPRSFALLPFGGAGPMHAAALAGELGISRILCPRASGVLSALGLASSERRRDSQRTVGLRGPELTAERISHEVHALATELAEGMSDPRLEATYDLRYRGQSFELSIAGPPEPDPGELAERFGAEHERRYGYRDPAGEVELVNVGVGLVEPGEDPRPAAAGPGGLERSGRRARFAGEWLEAEILRGEPPEGAFAEGPCVFELGEATLVLPPGWRGSVDAHGTVTAERTEGGT